MFTGIVRDIGKIVFLDRKKDSLFLKIETRLPLSDLAIGLSVACNGCCLTIIHVETVEDCCVFAVEVGPETLAVTGFSHLHVGSLLNLEPALRVGDSLSGHQVTGHIDTTCPVLAFVPLKDGFWKLSLKVNASFSKWLIPKGSIAVTGISLTVAQKQTLDDKNIQIDMMIIPHTFEHTTLSFLASSGLPDESKKLEVEFDPLTKAIASTIENMIPMYI